jgi:hypothetical protein
VTNFYFGFEKITFVVEEFFWGAGKIFASFFGVIDRKNMSDRICETLRG